MVNKSLVKRLCAENTISRSSRLCLILKWDNTSVDGEDLLQKKVGLKKDPNARDLYGNTCLS